MSDAFPGDWDDASTSIESAVLALTARAESLTGLWSTVELEISREDVSWLKRWLSLNGPNCRTWLRSDDRAAAGPPAFTQRERLGLLLIVLAGEVARED